MAGARDHHFSSTLRIISTIVLSFFLWTFGGVFDIAWAVKNSEQLSAISSQRLAAGAQQGQTGITPPSLPLPQGEGKRPEVKFGKDMEDLEKILHDDKTDHDTKKQRIKTKKAEIDADDIEIRKQFKETEEKIKHLPGEIWRRHQDFVKKYDDNLKELRTNLDDIDKAKTDKEKELAHKKAKDFVEKVKAPKKHQKLDPNKLPHRTEEPVWKEPRTKPEEFEKDSDQRLAGSNQQQPYSKASFPLVGNLSEERLRASRSDNIGARGVSLLNPTLAKGGEGGFSGKESKPLLIAANGPLTGLLNKTAQYSYDPVIPRLDRGIQNPGYPTEVLGYDRQNDRSIAALPEGSYQIALANPPTSADLAETIEVQFTPEITAKATELGNNPVKIYNWVRNNIEYVPTYGSIQGANMCLQTKLCNDFDTASLLIALLRASGIHARYVYGTIEVPIEKVKNWVGGFTDSMEALRLLASAGVPTKGLVDVGVIKYARLEHIYVEAWIDYFPSRGEKHKVGDTWISLDASFKQYTYTQGMDIKTAVPFDAQTFINQVQSTATINEQAGYVTNVNSLYVQQSMQDYQTRVQNYISQNYPNATVGDVLDKKEIIQKNHSYLMGTLPYKRIVAGAKYSALPNSLRQRLSFSVVKDLYDSEIGTPINVTKSLPELAGKRISLKYVAATAADQTILDNYSTAAFIPAYLVNLKAELKVDNTVIATGPPVTMGMDQMLNLTFASPKGSEIEMHLMSAGDYNVIGLNLGGARTIFESRVAQSDLSDPVSEMLYQTILGYWAEYDTLKELNAKRYSVSSVRIPSEGLSGVPVSIKYLFGTAWSGSYASRGLDVRRDLDVVSSLAGNKEASKAFNESAGIIGSLFEGLVFDQLFKNSSGQGLSTIKILASANAHGIPLYYITRDNITTILPNLQVASDVLIDIQNVVNAGKEVVIPRTVMVEGDWTGTGYIAIDPNTGNGGYIISGGAAGAFFMYDAKMRAALAIDETPFSPGILKSVQDWMGLVGAPALGFIKTQKGIDFEKMVAEEAARQVEEKDKGSLIRASLRLLTIVGLAVIIAIALDEITAEFNNDDFWPFRHYTTFEGRAGILRDKIIWDMKEYGDLGPGAYVTDLRLEPDGADGPNTARLFRELNMPKYKLVSYVEIWINPKTVFLRNGTPDGWPHQYVHPFLPLIIDNKNVIISN